MLHHLETTEHLSLGVLDGLALLEGDAVGDLLAPLCDEVPQTEHVSGTLGDGEFAPLGEGLLGVLDGLFHLALCALWDLCNDLIRSLSVWCVMCAMCVCDVCQK